MKGNKFFKSYVAGLVLTNLTQGASNNTVNAAWYDVIIIFLSKLDFFGWFSSNEKSLSKNDNSDKGDQSLFTISEEKITKIDNKVLPKEVIDTNNEEHEIKNNENSIYKPNGNEEKIIEYKTMGNFLINKDKMTQNEYKNKVYPKK